MEIPNGSSVTIDGKINEDEWKEALSQDLKNGGSVKLKHDGEFLQIGLLCGKDVFVFHASAALGKW